MGASTWFLDTSDPEQPLVAKEEGEQEGQKADVTLTMKEEEFLKLVAGKSNPQVKHCMKN